MSKLLAILLFALIATALAMPEGYFRVKRSRHGFYKEHHDSPWHQNRNGGGYGGNYYGGGGAAQAQVQAQASSSAGGWGNTAAAGASSSSYAYAGGR